MISVVAMWAVFYNRGDWAGQWIADGLRLRGLEPMELVAADALATAIIDHRLEKGRATVTVMLPDGRCLESGAVRGIVNRIVSLPPPQLLAGDRDYGMQESAALFVSWMSCLGCRILNRPTPYGFNGRWRSPEQWSALARRAGFSCHSSRETSLTASGFAQAFVVGQRCLLPHGAGADVDRACRALARLGGDALRGITLMDGGDQWLFAGASAVPDLTSGGDPLIDAVAQELTS